ncbi:MAG: endolytic transglycosylase MltG [Pseudomonadota bacterium]
MARPPAPIRWLGALLGLGLGGGLVLLVGFLVFEQKVNAPGPNREPVIVQLDRGMGVRAIARRLHEAGVIEQPALFVGLTRWQGAAAELKAGEYAFPAAVPAIEVLAMLRAGRVIQYRLTIPEGLTVAEAMALIGADPVLTGDLPPPPGEGRLLPDTYFFTRGETRAALVARMERALERELADAWEERAEGLPLDSADEALILASIIEKETGVAEERGVVAGVFVNRLRRGMRLQTDPTVIYALTRGVGPLGRELLRRDLDVDDPYNTYRFAGLPPGPIALPGRASIRAAVDPERTDYLYFVADGTGGHAFARTLQEHNRNVAQWRRIERERVQRQGG